MPWLKEAQSSAQMTTIHSKQVPSPLTFAMHSIAILSFIARRRSPLIPIVGAHLYFRKAHLGQLSIEPIIKHDSIGLTEC